MGKIILHTPMHLSDENTTTEYEANDIIHVKSIVGNDNRDGTHFYINGMPERQSCLESANILKNLIQKNKTNKEKFSIGSMHIGDQVHQNGVMFWWKDVKFQTGILVGFVVGFLSSLLASWVFARFT